MTDSPDLPKWFTDKNPRAYRMRPFKDRGYFGVVNPNINPFDYHLDDESAELIKQWLPEFDPDNADVPALEALMLTEFGMSPADVQELTWPQMIAMLRSRPRPPSNGWKVRVPDVTAVGPGPTAGQEGQSGGPKEQLDALRELRGLYQTAEGFGGRGFAGLPDLCEWQTKLKAARMKVLASGYQAPDLWLSVETCVPMVAVNDANGGHLQDAGKLDLLPLQKAIAEISAAILRLEATLSDVPKANRKKMGWSIVCRTGLWLVAFFGLECAVSYGAWRWGIGDNLWQRITNSWPWHVTAFGACAVFYPFLLGRERLRVLKFWKGEDK